ncbi:MAG TPA: hypothetical protein VHQ41_01630 [Patescibacteria group bacterium]|jgi:hypothetical protein|nr:hypothetical protein [Patescibacteria group bacterium]
MNKLISSFLLVFGLLVIHSSASAQQVPGAKGHWVPCLDPGGSGYTVSCLVFDPPAPRAQPPASVNVTVNVTQPAQPPVSPLVQQPQYAPPPPSHQSYQYGHGSTRYSPENSGVYNSIPSREEPVYQTQRARTTHQDYDIGFSPYSRRPYGHYSRSTDTVTLTITTNDPNFRPDIRVNTYGSGYYNQYYWPRY